MRKDLSEYERKLCEMLTELIGAWDETETNPKSDKLFNEDMWDRARELCKEAE